MSKSEENIYSEQDAIQYEQALDELATVRGRWLTISMMLCIPVLAFALYLTRKTFPETELIAITFFFVFLLACYFATHLSFVKKNAYRINLLNVASVMLLLILYSIFEENYAPDLATMYGWLMMIIFALMGVILFMPLKFEHACFFGVTFLIFYTQQNYVTPDVEVIHRISAVVWLSVFIAFFLFENFHANRLRKANFYAQLLITREKAKSEALMDNMIPRQIADRLKKSQSTIADNIGEASVLFADLVGFTAMSSKMLPSKVVELIDEIFSRFDDIVESHGLEKIKTVGDSYMAVAGAPIEMSDHAIAAARAAIDMREALYQFNDERKEQLDIRIGIHSGSLVGGVIGKKKMTYDVWGDTVNTASRMESHSEKGQIQVSEQTYHLLKQTFDCESRGEIDVKGKGLMSTYFLNQKES